MKKAVIILSAIALLGTCGNSPKKTAEAVTVPEDGTEKFLKAIL